MTLLADLIAHLEGFAALTPLAPEGLCTQLAGSDAGAALCGAGTVAREIYLSGARCETREYRLLLRTALLTDGERAAFHARCEEFCAAVNDAGALPVLTEPGVAADALHCGAPVQTAADDSGLSTFTLPLQLQFTRWQPNITG